MMGDSSALFALKFLRLDFGARYGVRMREGQSVKGACAAIHESFIMPSRNSHGNS